ncbi:transposase [Kitasatospora aureofaciens]|uniref:transposase n=1 Tax=Kitasatospora aureofaciens TaxID=1894 RepID=UPI0009961DB3|nr:transposase [Kitasatospora aureofaciens]
MAGKRRSFDAEFRAGAVRIVTETGKSAAEVARDLPLVAWSRDQSRCLVADAVHRARSRW